MGSVGLAGTMVAGYWLGVLAGWWQKRKLAPRRGRP